MENSLLDSPLVQHYGPHVVAWLIFILCAWVRIRLPVTMPEQPLPASKLKQQQEPEDEVCQPVDNLACRRPSWRGPVHDLEEPTQRAASGGG